MNIRDYNRDAWNRLVEKGDRWTRPVTQSEVAQAREGKFSIFLTPSKPVPSEWFPPLSGLKVLCLASGGGQQGPILSAAGAEVTVFDNSPGQLGQDRLVAERDGLELQTVEGDMTDLSAFEDSSFNLIFQASSNCFVEDLTKVWSEAYRVLAPGGTLLSGLSNPVPYLFSRELEKKEIFQLKFGMPYADITCLTQEELKTINEKGEPFLFAHSLEDQLSGQIAAGFRLIGFYDDDWGGHESIDKHFKSFFATRAEKPTGSLLRAEAMLHHLSLAVIDLPRSAAFYDVALSQLGYVRLWTDSTGVGYGLLGSGEKFAIKLSSSQAEAPGRGFHLAFAAPSRKSVARFHAAALQHGGRDNGLPELCPEYGEHYYAAFVIDPDGYRIEAVITTPA